MYQIQFSYEHWNVLFLNNRFLIFFSHWINLKLIFIFYCFYISVRLAAECVKRQTGSVIPTPTLWVRCRSYWGAEKTKASDFFSLEKKKKKHIVFPLFEKEWKKKQDLNIFFHLNEDNLKKKNYGERYCENFLILYSLLFGEQLHNALFFFTK